MGPVLGSVVLHNLDKSALQSGFFRYLDRRSPDVDRLIEGSLRLVQLERAQVQSAQRLLDFRRQLVVGVRTEEGGKVCYRLERVRFGMQVADPHQRHRRLLTGRILRPYEGKCVQNLAGGFRAGPDLDVGQLQLSGRGFGRRGILFEQLIERIRRACEVPCVDLGAGILPERRVIRRACGRRMQDEKCGHDGQRDA